MFLFSTQTTTILVPPLSTYAFLLTFKTPFGRWRRRRKSAKEFHAHDEGLRQEYARPKQIESQFRGDLPPYQECCQGLESCDQFCELHHFINMYNYFLKVRVSLRTLSSLVINLLTQVAIVLKLALVSSQVSRFTGYN